MIKSKPKDNFYDNLPRYLNLKFVFNIILIVVVGINTFQLLNKIQKLKNKRKISPYIFLGAKFSGLKATFKNVQYVGYYTDKNLDNNKHAAQYAQAQYILAPIILDLDYSKHEYILFDCTSAEVARQKVKETNAVPLKMNNFGIILAKRRK